MRAINRKRLGFTAGLLIALVSGAPVLADDTELFLAAAAPGSQVQPNILFILDTSGSMGTQITTQQQYDPNVVYPGTCVLTKVYWREGPGAAPVCATNRLFDLVDGQKGIYVCQAGLDAMATVGFFTDRMAQFDKQPLRWIKLTPGNQNSENVVDCYSDRGLHGDGTDPDKIWAMDGDSNVWSDDQADEISWSDNFTGQSFTTYSANYLNWFSNAQTVTQSRLLTMQDVLINLLDSIDSVNVGLMRFMDNRGPGDAAAEGGPVIHAMEDIATARVPMQTAISNLTDDGWTPLAETLYEAGLYYRGGAVDYGLPTLPVSSVPASRMPADQSLYDSPVEFACQKNFAVLLTDGLPTQDNGGDAKIISQPGFSTLVAPDCNGAGSGRCLDDMAEYLFETDVAPTIPGQQNVVTYTIGFNINPQILVDTATRGGGQRYLADDTATLASALTNIVAQILQTNTTFAAPAVSVNAFNRTQNIADLFITVFQPTSLLHWPGNVKKYQLINKTIVGADGTTPVIDQSTGFFRDTSQSIWSTVVDGSDVTLGGAAEQIPDPISRNVYTYTGSDPDLTNSTNVFEDANAAITDAMMGLGNVGDPARQDVIDWARGLDNQDGDQDNDFTDTRQVMGDPLHSKPTSVIYGGTTVTPDITDAVVYAATNDGYIHAIDGDTGAELWAFIPPTHLGSLRNLYLDLPQPNKFYGVDGNMVSAKVDINQNGIVEPAGGDKVFLYYGMRRGGDAYVAMDVTDKNAPRYLWTRDAASLPLLGQTWSTPVLAHMVINGTAQNPNFAVLVFGGGYDGTQDNTLISTDGLGTGIYILDAVSGNLLWRAGPDSGADLRVRQMDYSIPAGVRVIDIDNDKFADRMYAADMGGQVWRFDILNGQPPSTFVTGGTIASLGAADMMIPDVQNSRRLYSATDVSLINKQDNPYIHIGIGSGYRAHPLETIQDDRFYAIRDYNIFGKLSQIQYDSLTPLTEADLVDVTSNLTPVLQPNANGWMIRMEDVGEKILSEARTFDNKIFFPSFTPGAAGGNGCLPGSGLNRLYVVAVDDGSPVTNLDNSIDPNNLTLTDRSRDLAQGGIAPETVFLFPPSTDPNDPLPPPECLIGLENCPIGLTNRPVRTFWTQDGAE